MAPSWWVVLCAIPDDLASARFLGYHQVGYQLTIHNTGRPIPAEQLPLLFERFRRYDEGRTEGYGLGLAVVRSVAQFHSIRLGADSDEQGTAFTLDLPTAGAGDEKSVAGQL